MTSKPQDLAPGEYLSPTEYVDAAHPQVRVFAEQAASGAQTPIDVARALYVAVRDTIRYTPYADLTDRESYRASSCLAAGRGYCVAKAALLAASARHLGVPARIGLADVRNHLTSVRLRELMDSDVFYYHGFAELYLEDRWVRVTPTFDARLCRRLNVSLLEFDGRHDALFHRYNSAGQQYMEYLRYHGSWQDVPVAMLMTEMQRLYPHMAAAAPVDADFAAEARSA